MTNNLLKGVTRIWDRIVSWTRIWKFIRPRNTTTFKRLKICTWDGFQSANLVWRTYITNKILKSTDIFIKTMSRLSSNLSANLYSFSNLRVVLCWRVSLCNFRGKKLRRKRLIVLHRYRSSPSCFSSRILTATTNP